MRRKGQLALIIAAATAATFVLLTFFYKADAQISNPHPTPPTNSVTHAMLQTGIIDDSNVASSAAISADKIANTTNNKLVTTSSQTFAGAKEWSGVQTFDQTPITTSTAPTLDTQLTTKSYVDTAVGVLKLISDETLTAGEPVSISDGTSALSITQTATSSSIQGVDNTVHYYAQTFKTSATDHAIYAIDFDFNGSAFDEGGYALSIRATDASSTPTGSDLSVSTQILRSGSGEAMVTYTLPTELVVTPNTTYAIIFRAISDPYAHYQYLYYTNTNPYANGSYFDGGTAGTSWTATTANDFYFKVHTAPVEPGHIGAAGAATANWRATGFIGFAHTSATDGSTIPVDVIGVVGNQSGLTPATRYYLANATGTIATSVGSTTVKVGLGISSTSILINYNW